MAEGAEGADGVYRSTRQTNEKFHTTGLLKIYQTIGEGQNWQTGQLSSNQVRDRQGRMGREGIGGV